MSENYSFTRASRVLITVAALVVVIAGMRAASSILVPFLMAIFLAIISTPPLFWLQKRGASPAVALIIVIGVVVAIGFATVAMVGASVDEFSAALPVYEATLKEKSKAVMDWLAGYEINFALEGISQYVNPESVMGLVRTLLNGVAGIVTNALLISLAVAFILVEASTITAKLRVMVDDPEDTTRRLSSFVDNVNQYLVIKSAVSFITGIIVTIWLWILGVDFPVLWGWLAFFLNFVPYVGSIIAALPPLLLAFLQPELGLSGVLWVSVCYVAVNIIVGNVIEPRFFGQGLGLSTFVVFASLVFWGWVLGPVGMLLSIPLTMLVKIAMEADERTHWIAVMLSAHPTQKQ